MPQSRVIQIAVPRPLHAVYDYEVPANMPLPVVGARLRVPFGRSRTVGICISTEVPNPHDNLRCVLEVLDTDAFVPADLMALAQWMTGYYHYPLGEVLATMLPAAARNGATAAVEPPDIWLVADADGACRPPDRARAQQALFDHLHTTGPLSGAEILAAGFKRANLKALIDRGAVVRGEAAESEAAEQPPQANAEQAAAISAVTGANAGFQCFLLQGVTGSGKTEVYLRAMADLVARGRQVLVLVPEIALTPQTLARFRRRFAKVGMLHSNLSDQARLQTWLGCAQGDISVLIGTRSAVFAPFVDLALIVVDEEHDSSYKQQDGLRYSARDIAIKRGLDHGIPVLLGSATPSLESLYNVQRERYLPLYLTERAGGAAMPDYHVIDMRGQSHTDGISIPLERVMRAHLEQRGQVLLYLNRRGFSPILLCTACGWQAQCSDCDARLTLHLTPRQLICHHCSLRFEIPADCEHCGASDLLPVGMGTQRTEQAVQRLFKGLPVYRIDRDTTRSARRLEARFDEINTGNPCIMVGTQMLAKGHHFANVTLVAVLNADAGFLSPDFRAPERTAQLIVQVAGRAGRAQRPGEVWIQSYQPDNAALISLIQDGYPGFAAAELAQRIKIGLPPATPMALFRAESTRPQAALDLLNACKSQLSGVQTMGPVPAPLARVANRSRFQLMLLGESRRALHGAIDRLHLPQRTAQVRWSIDIDPYDSL